MNSNNIEESVIENAVRFHGHQCPGLAVGIRVSEVVLRELGKPARDEEMVAIVENNSCGVDAIQLLTGCTFGKGNLVFNDFGKSVYTFINRETNKALRISINKDAYDTDEEHRNLFAKVRNKTASESERELFTQKHIKKSNEILDLPEDKLMTIEQVEPEPVQKARIHESLDCVMCNEPVMETRVRLLNGEAHCIPCFEGLTGNNS
ncbi:MAG: TraR/DksA C4-type zinc finger protein [Methanosarcinales archaeon]|nr:TraR/DksA C4-type zinc finger protein [Methanosarcinales archaeon]